MSKTKSKGIIFISNVSKALEHEWFCDYISKSEFDIEFVLFNSKNSELFNYIVNSGLKCENFTLKSKFFIPFYVLRFFFKFLFTRYHFIHCHLFEASIIGLTAAKFAGVKKRIHTRHHADFHHTYFPNAVKYDLLNNRLSTHIVAVSNNIKKLLVEREHVISEKITIIPHGIPSSIINKTVPVNEIDLIRRKYNLEKSKPVVGVVSRFTEWKGIQYIIPAFKRTLQDFPNAKLVLANAQGDYEAHIKKMLSELPDNSYVLIPFENNMPSLFKSFDVFVHTPVDKVCEAFGQVYIEALSLEVPMICTLSGIANDFIINEENAMVVGHRTESDIYEKLFKIFNNEELKNRIIKNGKQSVQKFSFEIKFEKLKQLYLI